MQRSVEGRGVVGFKGVLSCAEGYVGMWMGEEGMSAKGYAGVWRVGMQRGE